MERGANEENPEPRPPGGLRHHYPQAINVVAHRNALLDGILRMREEPEPRPPRRREEPPRPPRAVGGMAPRRALPVDLDRMRAAHEPRPRGRREARRQRQRPPRAVGGMAPRRPVAHPIVLAENDFRMQQLVGAGANHVLMGARDLGRVPFHGPLRPGPGPERQQTPPPPAIQRNDNVEDERIREPMRRMEEGIREEEREDVQLVPEPDLDRRAFVEPEERERSPSPIREAVMPPVPVRPPVPPEVIERIDLLLQQARADFREAVQNRRRRRVPNQEVHNAGVNVNEENPEPRPPERREEGPREIGGMVPRRPLPPPPENVDRMEVEVEDRDRPIFQAEILRPPRAEPAVLQHVVVVAEEAVEMNNAEVEEERQQTPPPLAIPRNDDEEDERRRERRRRIEEPPPEIVERVNLLLQQAHAELQREDLVRNQRRRRRVRFQEVHNAGGNVNEENPEPHPPERREGPRAIGEMAPRGPLPPPPEDLDRMEAEVEAHELVIQRNREDRDRPVFRAEILQPPRLEPAVVENVVVEAEEPVEMNNAEVEGERQQTPPPLAIPRIELDQRRPELMRRIDEPPEVLDRVRLILRQAGAEMQEVRNRRRRVPIQENQNARVNVNEENPEPRPPERREEGPRAVGGMAPRRPLPPLPENLDMMEVEVEAVEAELQRNHEEAVLPLLAREDRDRPILQAEILPPPRQEPAVVENVVAEAEEAVEMNNDEVEEGFQRVIAEENEIIEGMMRMIEEEEREEQPGQVLEIELVPELDEEEEEAEDEFEMPPFDDHINVLLRQAQAQFLVLDNREERIQREVQEFARNRGPRVPIQEIHAAMMNARQREREREMEEERLLQLEDANPDEGVEDLIDVEQFLRENADAEQEPPRNRFFVMGDRQEPVLLEAERLRTRQRKLPESEELHFPRSEDSAWYRWSEYDVLDWASKFIRSNGNTQLLRSLELDGVKLKKFLSKRNGWARIGMPYGMYIQLKGHFNRVRNYVSGFSYP